MTYKMLGGEGKKKKVASLAAMDLWSPFFTGTPTAAYLDYYYLA
jgi:hypothetical protein